MAKAILLRKVAKGNLKRLSKILQAKESQHCERDFWWRESAVKMVESQSGCRKPMA
jgi:hypothetical protein